MNLFVFPAQADVFILCEYVSDMVFPAQAGDFVNVADARGSRRHSVEGIKIGVN